MEQVSRLILPALLSFAVCLWPGPVQPQDILRGDQAAQKIVIGNVRVEGGAISAELGNRSSRPLRDVQLLIRYTWHWKNEFRPGKDDPGIAVYHTVDREIAPGGTTSFQYKPPEPLPSRPDGYFEVTVAVAGFTEIIR